MSLAYFMVTVVLLVVGLSLTEANEKPLVRLANQVEIEGLSGDSYQSFVGIPYAEPPINNLRFAVSNAVLSIRKC